MSSSQKTSAPDMSTTAGKIADLHLRLAEAHTPTGEETIAQRHHAGQHTARERVELLLDHDSFVEIDALAKHRSTAFGADKKRPVTDGIVSGHGTIDGRPVCVISQDFSIFEGRIGETAGEKILKILDLAKKSGTPVITFYEGLGVRIAEGVTALEYFTRILRMQSRLSGVVPQIAVVAGKVDGELLHSIVLNDAVIKIDSDVSDATVLASTAHFHVPHERAAIDTVADLLSYLPSNNQALPLTADSATPATPAEALDSVIPDDDTQVYDAVDVLNSVLDKDSLLELRPEVAPQLIAGFARIEGRSCGVLASQPARKNGALDSISTEKAARLIRFCDAFNVPLVTFIDSPGLLPDIEDLNGGAGDSSIRRAAKLVNATAEASVGKISVVTRHAFGSAYMLLGAKRLGTDLAFAWPTARIAVADAATMAAVLDKDEAKISDMLLHPYAAAERGLIDAVIPPHETRRCIADGLRLLERKVEDAPVRKHDNVIF